MAVVLKPRKHESRTKGKQYFTTNYDGGHGGEIRELYCTKLSKCTWRNPDIIYSV